MRGMSIRQRSLRRPVLLRALACGLVAALALATVPAPAQAGPRLDRAEREELRYELRRQAREDRERLRRDFERDEYRRGPYGGEREGYRRGDPYGGGREERHRMAPEDREQLRRMLREHRRGRQD